MDQIILEPEPKTFRCWSQKRLDAWSLKYEFRLHSPGVYIAKPHTSL